MGTGDATCADDSAGADGTAWRCAYALGDDDADGEQVVAISVADAATRGDLPEIPSPDDGGDGTGDDDQNDGGDDT